MERKFLSAGEFAREIGVCKNTLANYERSGVIIPHHKNPSGYRFYLPEQVEEYFSRGKKGGTQDGSAND